MADDVIKKNSEALERELAWFQQVLEKRIKHHFEQPLAHDTIFKIKPPDIRTKNSMYENFIAHYEMSAAERLVFMLSLAPHIKPQVLDVFLTRNTNNEGFFAEFGGHIGDTRAGFLPTGETALFLLAGDNLEGRLNFSHIFNAEHFFASHNVLQLDNQESQKTQFGGLLRLSQEIIDLVTTGNVRKPTFSMDFPAKLITSELEWKDLVLEPFTMERLREIKAWIKHGDILLNDLGLKRHLKPGFRSLFYGPSGTGKTLTAALLGKDMELDVYRIDLSMVVSKYIGETEKNLERIFHQAEYKNWILFFDEADALFGKRTEVHDAHDRFANQEVSYLLQRVEDYPGVVILATNMKVNLDEAFYRRFQSVVHFPMPRPNERQKLWQNGFSTKTSLEKAIDLREIGQEYELSGGSIMNVVRYASLMALRDKRRTIRQDELIEGIHREYQKEGKAV